MTSPLAWLDGARRLCLTGRDGARISTAPPIPWGQWAVGAEGDEVHSWPTWSPDGQRLASFRIARERGLECHVRVTERDGVTATEIAELSGRLPIYLQWAPDGATVRLLTQAGEVLHLDEADAHVPGEPVRLVQGSPLFFVPAGDRIVAFVGDVDGPSLLVFEDGDLHALDGVPGNFCAPQVAGDDAIYVCHGDDGMELVATALDGTRAPRRLADVHGLASFTMSPTGSRLAFAVDPEGTGGAYRGLSLLDPSTGDREPLTDLPLIAWFWQPDGLGLLGVEPVTGGTTRWHRIGLDGYTQPLVELHATRDLRFYLRFFEQFSASHPLVDPTSKHLVLAGGLTGHDNPRGTPRIWRVGLDDLAVEELDEGMFATYAPRSP